jgi:hypothetical protein
MSTETVRWIAAGVLGLVVCNALQNIAARIGGVQYEMELIRKILIRMEETMNARRTENSPR